MKNILLKKKGPKRTKKDQKGPKKDHFKEKKARKFITIVFETTNDYEVFVYSCIFCYW